MRIARTDTVMGTLSDTVMGTLSDTVMGTLCDTVMGIALSDMAQISLLLHRNVGTLELIHKSINT